MQTGPPYSAAAPSKPKGPLKVSDVTAKNCKLDWKKPEDDGGAPITAYAVEKMDVTQPGMCERGLVTGVGSRTVIL